MCVPIRRMAYIEPLNPLQKSRLSHIFLEYGNIEVRDGAFVLVDGKGGLVQVPLATFSTVFLEPGTTITHAAVALAASSGTALVWTGAGGTRAYAVGRASSGDVQRLLHQAKCFHQDDLRLKVVRNMYNLRFNEPAPERRSLEQLRGIEGSRVKATYAMLATKYRVAWAGRKYDSKEWDAADDVNRALSAGNACVHGLCEAVLVACGYSPAIGFLHTGSPLAFVYDIADLYKLEISAPLAFRLAAAKRHDIERVIREQLRDIFKESSLISRIITDTDKVLEVA